MDRLSRTDNLLHSVMGGQPDGVLHKVKSVFNRGKKSQEQPLSTSSDEPVQPTEKPVRSLDFGTISIPSAKRPPPSVLVDLKQSLERGESTKMLLRTAAESPMEEESDLLGLADDLAVVPVDQRDKCVPRVVPLKEVPNFQQSAVAVTALEAMRRPTTTEPKREKGREQAPVVISAEENLSPRSVGNPPAKEKEPAVVSEAAPVSHHAEKVEVTRKKRGDSDREGEGSGVVIAESDRIPLVKTPHCVPRAVYPRPLPVLNKVEIAATTLENKQAPTPLPSPPAVEEKKVEAPSATLAPAEPSAMLAPVNSSSAHSSEGEQAGVILQAEISKEISAKDKVEKVVAGRDHTLVLTVENGDEIIAKARVSKAVSAERTPVEQPEPVKEPLLSTPRQAAVVVTEEREEESGLLASEPLQGVEPTPSKPTLSPQISATPLEDATVEPTNPAVVLTALPKPARMESEEIFPFTERPSEPLSTLAASALPAAPLSRDVTQAKEGVRGGEFLTESPALSLGDQPQTGQHPVVDKKRVVSESSRGDESGPVAESPMRPSFQPDPERLDRVADDEEPLSFGFDVPRLEEEPKPKRPPKRGAKQGSPNEAGIFLYSGINLLRRFSGKAIQSYLSTVSLDGNLKYRYYRDRGERFFQSGLYKRAARYFEWAQAESPDQAELLGPLGLCYLKTNRISDGIRLLEEAAEKGCTVEGVYEKLAVAYTNLGEDGKAIENLEKALLTEPKSAKLHYRLAVAFDNLGEYDRAIQLFQKALEINPKSAKVYRSMGFSLEQAGRREDAIQCFKWASELEGGSSSQQAGVE
ncbi:MAG: tetratricopeptide repeat protein [Magnetococcales bacterium]|nr:tetratricopeptide repeat protein [Magnetococcales bacterium]